MKNDKCCGTCRYHVPDGKFPDDWLCVNDKSEHIADYTEYDEICDFWEEREKISRKRGQGMNLQDIAEAVGRLKRLERERELLAQMRFEEKIREVVIVCSPANKYKLKEAIPSLFVVGSSACEDDKCYMVTDKELAEQFKKAVRE